MLCWGCGIEPGRWMLAKAQRSPIRDKVASGRSGCDTSPAIAKGDNSIRSSGTDSPLLTLLTLSVHTFREGYEHGCQAPEHIRVSLPSPVKKTKMTTEIP